MRCPGLTELRDLGCGLEPSSSVMTDGAPDMPPGPAAGLRTKRGKILGSICTIVLLAVIGITVYAMTPFRAYGQRTKLPATTSSSVSAPSATPAVHKTSTSSHTPG